LRCTSGANLLVKTLVADLGGERPLPLIFKRNLFRWELRGTCRLDPLSLSLPLLLKPLLLDGLFLG